MYLLADVAVLLREDKKNVVISNNFLTSVQLITGMDRERCRA